MAALDGPTAEVLLLISLLMLKHFVCDFVLQTAYQAHNKGFYGHPGGLLHAAIHALGSVAALGLAAAPAPTIAAIAVAEFALHYHIDFFKERLTRAQGWTPSQRAFWIALGFDQLLHGLTYVAIVWWVATL